MSVCGSTVILPEKHPEQCTIYTVSLPGGVTVDLSPDMLLILLEEAEEWELDEIMGEDDGDKD